MSNLIDTINQNLPTPFMKIEIQDVLNNSRPAFVITDDEVYTFLLILMMDSRIKSIEDINADTEKHGIMAIEDKALYPESGEKEYQCIDWLFNKIGMPQYTEKQGLMKLGRLLYEDTSDIYWIPEPEEGAIVVYFNPSDKPPVRPKHVGLVTEVNKKIIIQSKWSTEHVYEHPLETKSPQYGNAACFFKTRPE